MNPRHHNGRNSMINFTRQIISIRFFRLFKLDSHIGQRHFSIKIRENSTESDVLHLFDIVCFANLLLCFVAEHGKSIQLWSNFLLHLLRNPQ
jgi:hypothetical protein